MSKVRLLIAACLLSGCYRGQKEPATTGEAKALPTTQAKPTAPKPPKDQAQYERRALRAKLETALADARHSRREAQEVIDFEGRMKVEFGLLDALQRLQSVDIAKRLASGQGITKEQLEFARGLQVFRIPLQRVALALADGKPLPRQGDPNVKGPPFESILRMTGQWNGFQEARQREQTFAEEIRRIKSDLRSLDEP